MLKEKYILHERIFISVVKGKLKERKKKYNQLFDSVSGIAF